MFPPTYSSSGPYPYFPSSSSSSSYHPFTFLNPENTSSSNTFPHDPLSAVPYIPTTHHHAPIPETLTNFAVADYAAMFKNDVSGAHYGSISNLPANKKPASKKDRHSKIHTSQGLRDRRVRLSIEIARKFFDLQDMLGFDKASNTLEWLFNKSKKAMKDLARSKNSSNSFSFSSSSECEEVVSVINQDATSEGVEVVEESKGMKLKRAKMKESREKARARARERTSNKMCNTSGSVKVQDLKKKCPETENPQILHQLMRSSPFQPAEDSARSPPNKVLQQPHHNPHLVGSEVQRDHDFNVIEESIVIKRKLKQSLMSSSYHQNLGIPTEAGFSNSDQHHSSFPNLSPNWDANGATGRNSNFCALASMNLSTGLQIFGKSWEECTNPRL